MKKFKFILKKHHSESKYYVFDKKLYNMQNRTDIIVRYFVIVLILLFAALIAYICLSRSKSSQNMYSNISASGIKTDVKIDKTKAEPNAKTDKDDKEAAFDYSKSIICWGDSFADNTANSSTFFTYYLSENISNHALDINSVFSSGLEGDTVPIIAAKQGGIPMKVQPFTIPADKTPVPIELKSILGGNVILQDKLNSGLNPCQIAGIEGTIEYKQNKLSFIRSDAGKAVTVAEPTTVVTNAMSSIKGYTGVYFFGGDCTKYTPNELVNMYKKMVAFQGNDKYLIVGSVTGDSQKLEPYEKALEQQFASHYINLRKYLTREVFNDYEIKITGNDAKALQSGTVPPSFTLNGKRLSDQGSKILADLIFDRLIQLDLI